MTYQVKTSCKGHLSPLFFIFYRKQMLDVELKKAEPQTLNTLYNPRVLTVNTASAPPVSLASDRLGRTTGSRPVTQKALPRCKKGAGISNGY